MKTIEDQIKCFQYKLFFMKLTIEHPEILKEVDELFDTETRPIQEAIREWNEQNNIEYRPITEKVQVVNQYMNQFAREQREKELKETEELK